MQNNSSEFKELLNKTREKGVWEAVSTQFDSTESSKLWSELVYTEEYEAVSIDLVAISTDDVSFDTDPHPRKKSE